MKRGRFEFISKLIVFINELMRHDRDTNCGDKSPFKIGASDGAEGGHHQHIVGAP